MFPSQHAYGKDFCGHEDILERLETELLPSKNTVTASSTALKQFALCGLGGIGKMEIAREFARRLLDVTKVPLMRYSGSWRMKLRNLTIITSRFR